MIFVGGPLHGRDVETRTVDPTSGDYGEAPESWPVEVPVRSDVDGTPLLGTKLHVYRRINPNYILRVEGEPDRMFRNTAYIHPDIAAQDVPHRQLALADAMVTWWFLELGHEAAADPAESNGHKGAPGELAELPPPVAQFHAHCPCGDECHAFTLLERANWMRSHFDAGHKPVTYEPSPVDSEER